MTTKERIKEEARFIIDNNATVRQAADEFGIPKSTIHVHMNKRLPNIDMKLYKSVRKVFETNKEERYVRSAKANKERFRRLRES